MKKRLFDVEEIAEYLGVKPGTIYTWVCHREIPYVKIGRLTRFDLGVIEEWILENSVAVGKERKKEADEQILRKVLGDKPKTKICSVCGGEPKPLGLFYKDKRVKDGRVKRCKGCMKKEAQERWLKKKEKKKEAETEGETRKIKSGEIVDEAGQERARKALAKKRKAAFGRD